MTRNLHRISYSLVPRGRIFLRKLTIFNYNLVNKANLVHNFSWYVYFFSLHVSGDYVPIIRRNDYLCEAWYLSICVDDCLVRRLEFISTLSQRYIRSLIESMTRRMKSVVEAEVSGLLIKEVNF
jgi:hypothetical protein